MNENPPLQTPAERPRNWATRLALALAVLAIVASGVLWRQQAVTAEKARAYAEDLARAQRRINGMEDRLTRRRDELDRLNARIGTGREDADTVIGRVTRLEEAMAKAPGGEKARILWLLEQAEYFMRIANAQESLAGNTGSALTALGIADNYLRDTGDPRLTPVRKQVAIEIAALRAVPRVDTEGLILKLTTLADSLPTLPRRQAIPSSHSPEPAGEAVGSGFDRALAALRRAFLSIVSVRRADGPSAALLSEESEAAVVHSLQLELQMARLALITGQSATFRTSLGLVRESLLQYFDTAAPAGGAALATVDELTGTALPDSLPDLSVSLAELVRIREREAVR